MDLPYYLLEPYGHWLRSETEEMLLHHSTSLMLPPGLGGHHVRISFLHSSRDPIPPHRRELLGVTLGLQKTAYYTLGSEKLLILVDHKPLNGLLTTRELGDVENPRLQHLAEKLLCWTITIQHIAGTANKGPDALSRFPSSKDTTGLLASLNVINQAT